MSVGTIATGNRSKRRTVFPWPNGLLLLLPLATILIIFFIYPLLSMLWASFHASDPVELIDWKVFTFRHYAKFFGDSYYRGILYSSLRLSLITTVVCLVIGYPVAYTLSGINRRVQAYLLLLLISPLLVSLVIRTYAWTIILSPNGLVNAFLLQLGLIKTPLRLLWTETAVVIGLTHIYLAYMLLPIVSSLTSIDPSMVRAAMNLGANEWKAFRLVTLPLSVPGILAGVTLVFILTMSAFVTPTLLGGVRVKTLASTAYEQTIAFLQWPFGAAISFVLLLVTGLLVVIYQKVLERREWEASAQ